MREGNLFYDAGSGRYEVRFGMTEFYGGLHCGECMDVKVNGKWIPTRIEMAEGWYLVGFPDVRLDGLTVRL